MTLPAGLQTVTVHGEYLHPDGRPFQGRITFTPEPATITSPEHDVIVLGDVVAKPDTDGQITATLLATDAAGCTPTGWTYRVQEQWLDAPRRNYPVSLPAAVPVVDLADIAPTAPAAGEYTIVTGPAGPAGPKGDQGDPGPQPPLGAAGAGPTIALRSDDPTTTNSRIPTSHAASHADDGSDPVTPTAIGADPAGAAAAAQTAAVTAAGADSTSKVSAHTEAADPHGDRAYSDGVTGPIASRVAAVESGFTTVNGYITDAQVRVQALETNVVYKGDADITGPLSVGGYTTLAGGQANNGWSVFGALSVLAGDASTVHQLSATTAGFFGAAATTQPTVVGSQSSGEALASLLAALAQLGLITDDTTA